jgi:hypothetical protein
MVKLSRSILTFSTFSFTGLGTAFLAALATGFGATIFVGVGFFAGALTATGFLATVFVAGAFVANTLLAGALATVGFGVTFDIFFILNK